MGGVSDIITVMLVLAGAYILIKSGKLQEIFSGNFQLPALPPLPGLPAPAPAPAPEAAPAPEPPEDGGGGGGEEEGGGGGDEGAPEAAPPMPAAPAAGGGGGGGAPTGTSCPSGKECVSSNGGSRNECDGVTDTSYEATWCGQFSGDDMSVKTFGPNHSGSSCCWCILSVSPDGAMGIRHEGPHPDTSSKSGTGPAIGKPSCIKAIVRPGPGGINLEGWGLVGGQWKKGFSYQGECGYHSKSSKPAAQQQVAFRCDGSLQTTCATVAPIGGGGGGGPPAAAGGVRVGSWSRTGCGPKCMPSFDKLIAARSRQNRFDRILARL